MGQQDQTSHTLEGEKAENPDASNTFNCIRKNLPSVKTAKSCHNLRRIK